MGRPDGGYDAKKNWLYLPTAKPQHEPRYNAEVHGWLECMDPHLLDMLSTMPLLQDMTPALVLTGGASVGKTLLAIGYTKHACVDQDSRLVRPPKFLMDIISKNANAD